MSFQNRIGTSTLKKRSAAKPTKLQTTRDMSKNEDLTDIGSASILSKKISKNLGRKKNSIESIGESDNGDMLSIPAL